MASITTAVALGLARYHKKTAKPELDARDTAISDRLAEIDAKIVAGNEALAKEIGDVKAALVSGPFDPAEFDRAFEEGMKETST